MDGIRCDHCGKAVDITREPQPRLSSAWKRLPDGKITILVVCEDCEPLFEGYTSFCEVCPNDGSHGLYPFLRTLPTGEQEEILVCQECKSLFIERCCDHCGKAVDLTKEPPPRLFSVWKRLPHNKIAIITVCEDCEPLFERRSWYCDACGKDCGDERYMVLRTLPTGEQEEILVCQECRPLFGKIKWLSTILGGPTYTDEDRPPAWCNPVPLQYQGYHPSYRELNLVRRGDPERYADVVKQVAIDTTRFPQDDFPLIKDFEVILSTARMEHHRVELTRFWGFSASR